MTEKRFTVKQRQGATNYSIIDYYGELPLNEGMYYKSNAEKLCKWLNTQHELLNAFYKENEQLKSQDKDIQMLFMEKKELEDALARRERKVKEILQRHYDNKLGNDYIIETIAEDLRIELDLW